MIHTHIIAQGLDTYSNSREKPRIISSTVDMEKLRKLPDDTFGKSYVTFMDKYVSTYCDWPHSHSDPL